MARLGFLHLTDLHVGQKEQKWLWPSIRHDFFLDLKDQRERWGPWDVVLFSGDLTFSGKKQDFDDLTRELRELWTFFRTSCDSDPVLLAVPGNHDLQWLSETRALAVALSSWGNGVGFDKDLDKLRDAIWEPDNPDYRGGINAAFQEFSNWMSEWMQTHPKPSSITQGTLAGDFAARVERDGLSLGVLGLNSTFMQLTKKSMPGRLLVDLRQANACCGDNPFKWMQGNMVNFVMTHHPPSWLADVAQEQLQELCRPDLVAAHFFGHMHQPASTVTSSNNFLVDRKLQGASLCGLEKTHAGVDRKHGYTSGYIEDTGGRLLLKLWPRRANLERRERRFIADPAMNLDADGCLTLDLSHARQMASAGQSPPPAGGRAQATLNIRTNSVRALRAIVRSDRNSMVAEQLAIDLKLSAEEFKLVDEYLREKNFWRAALRSRVVTPQGRKHLEQEPPEF